MASKSIGAQALLAANLHDGDLNLETLGTIGLGKNDGHVRFV